MIHAYVRGVECVVYGYYTDENGIKWAICKYKNIANKIKVLQELIEIRREI